MLFSLYINIRYEDTSLHTHLRLPCWSVTPVTSFKAVYNYTSACRDNCLTGPLGQTKFALCWYQTQHRTYSVPIQQEWDLWTNFLIEDNWLCIQIALQAGLEKPSPRLKIPKQSRLLWPIMSFLVRRQPLVRWSSMRSKAVHWGSRSGVEGRVKHRRPMSMSNMKPKVNSSLATSVMS